MNSLAVSEKNKNWKRESRPVLKVEIVNGRWANGATPAKLYPVYTIEQTSSKYEACIKHSLYKTIIEQTSSWLVQLIHSSSSSQLGRVNGVLTAEFRLGRA